MRSTINDYVVRDTQNELLDHIFRMIYIIKRAQGLESSIWKNSIFTQVLLKYEVPNIKHQVTLPNLNKPSRYMCTRYPCL